MYEIIDVHCYISSPFLCVFGDNRVICYTGVDVVSGGDGDA